MSLDRAHLSVNPAFNDAETDPPSSERAPRRARAVVASTAVPIRPVWVSQATCLPACGWTPRRYLEWLRANPTVPRVHDGKLVLAPLDAIERRLFELAGCGQAKPEPSACVDDPPDAPTDEAAILALVGRRRKS